MYCHGKIPGLRPNEGSVRSVIFMSRGRLRLLIGVQTTHCALSKRLHHMGLTNSPLCRNCESAEEISVHLLVD